MNKDEIIHELDGEIERLRRARILLAGQERPGIVSAIGLARGKPRQGRRGMSAEARARISAAQKKRWAKQKGKTAPSAQNVMHNAVPGRRGTRRMSAAARARIAAAQRKRWAAVKAQKKK